VNIHIFVFLEEIWDDEKFASVSILGSLEVFPVKYVLGLVGICGFLKFLT
jgi:hypothetical protein